LQYTPAAEQALRHEADRQHADQAAQHGVGGKAEGQCADGDAGQRGGNQDAQIAQVAFAAKRDQSHDVHGDQQGQHDCRADRGRGNQRQDGNREDAERAAAQPGLGNADDQHCGDRRCVEQRILDQGKVPDRNPVVGMVIRITL
jgi:hypothetical protein